jgi:hypothetical protein
LTLSTTAQASLPPTSRPTSGRSTNTTSPSAVCAWSVMPMVTTSPPSMRTHSWLVVYFVSGIGRSPEVSARSGAG